MRVLIVVPGSGKEMARLFRERGWEAETAATDERAEQVVGGAQDPFDIAILWVESEPGGVGLLGCRYPDSKRLNDATMCVVLYPYYWQFIDYREVIGVEGATYCRNFVQEEESDVVQEALDLWKDRTDTERQRKKLRQLLADWTKPQIARLYGDRWVAYRGEDTLEGLPSDSSRVCLVRALMGYGQPGRRPITFFITEEGKLG